jgi:hypothetical protein
MRHYWKRFSGFAVATLVKPLERLFLCNNSVRHFMPMSDGSECWLICVFLAIPC